MEMIDKEDEHNQQWKFGPKQNCIFPCKISIPVSSSATDAAPVGTIRIRALRFDPNRIRIKSYKY
jgi:hypothetical protein